MPVTCQCAPHSAPTARSAALVFVFVGLRRARPCPGDTCSGAAHLDVAARFAQRVAAYEAIDETTAPPPSAILLAGDSQFDRWTTFREDLAGYTVINRGIDSFRTDDLVQYVDRLVIRYKPRLVVLHVGGNDIHQGKTPEQLLADTRLLVARIRTGLPGVPIAWSSITPGPGRWDEAPQRKRANALIKAWIATEKDLSFIDLWDAMLTNDGQAARGPVGRRPHPPEPRGLLDPRASDAHRCWVRRIADRRQLRAGATMAPHDRQGNAHDASRLRPAMIDAHGLRNACASRRDWLVDTTAALARIESPSGDVEALRPLRRGDCRARSRARRRDGRARCRGRAGAHLRATIGDGTRQVLLLGHFDTVWPIGTLAQMPVEIRDGRLHGPGTFDMKAGLAIAILAASHRRAHTCATFACDSSSRPTRKSAARRRARSSKRKLAQAPPFSSSSRHCRAAC